MKTIFRLSLVTILALAAPAFGATISGPTSSTTGSFTLTWPSGYQLRLSDATWLYASPPTTSYAFSNLPSGTYTFALYLCFTDSEGVTTCSADSASTKAVAVTRDVEPAIDTTTTEAGTLAYTASTTLRGSASIRVPLRTIDGVNGHAPALALAYDSARGSDISEYDTVDDSLGYGWWLSGLSRIHRCRAGLSGSGYPTLNTGDTLCLDGQYLKVVSGTYWADNSVYRTETNSFVQVTRKAGDWFEAKFPDGRIVNYGDTATSKVKGGGQSGILGPYLGANGTFIWGERQSTNGFGDVYTVDYEVHDGYGLIQPRLITYSGATVEFKYGPRSDLSAISLPTGPGFALSLIRRTSVLHTIKVKMNGTAVRDFRLDSNLVSSRLRLEKVQECGYSESGAGPVCLKPLAVSWASVTGGAENFPIAVSSFVDGLGANTQFLYSAITTSSNPLNYTETPFGAIQAASEVTAQPVAAVNEMRRSNGLTSGGVQRWTYKYKSFAYQNSLNRGYIGFYEVREKDEQTGVHSYSQVRLDAALRGAVSQRRTFSAAFGSGIELAREELAYVTKTQTGGLQYPYLARMTQWQFEGGVVVGGSEATTALCFRTLSGDTCPGTGVEGELVTQRTVTTLTGDTVSNPSFTPGFWGDVPDRTIGGTQLTRVAVANQQNTTTPWVVGNTIKTIVTDTAAGESARTVTTTFAYRSGTREITTATRLPGDPALNLTVTRTFTGNNLTGQSMSGADLPIRTENFGSAYVQDRYPPTVANPEGHSSSLDWDLRFGAADYINDSNANITTTLRDEFGRVVEVSEQDGSQTTIAYDRCDVVSCSAVTGAVAALKISVSASNGATQIRPTRNVYLDARGRQVLVEEQALDPTDGYRRTRWVYDAAGRVQQISKPYFSVAATPTCAAAGPNCTWLTYDVLGRVTREDRPDGGYTVTAFAGSAGSVTVTRTETVLQPGAGTVTRAKRSVFNVLGQLTSTIDAYGQTGAVTTTYDYTSHGDLDSVVVNGSSVATMTYDLARNRTQIVEPNTGTTTIDVDALGQVLSTTDAKGQVTNFQWDLIGRQTGRTDNANGSAVTNTWSWDPANGIGQLGSRSNGQFTETYSYRAQDSKIQSIVTNIAVSGVLTANYTRTIGYDSAGRVSTVAFPSLTVTRGYSAEGYLQELRSSTTVLHKFVDTDAFGNSTLEELYDGMRTVRTFDAASGRLRTISTGTLASPKSVQDLEAVWRSNGALYQRIDRRGTTSTTDDLFDTLTYDTLERLTQQATTTGASRTLSFAYDAYGNLTTKTSNVTADLDVTGYAYTASGKPHRLVSVTIGGVSTALTHDANGNITVYDAATGNDTYLSYDGRNNVTKITVGTSSTTPTPTARDEFWYAPDGDRYLGRESWDAGGVQKSAVTTYLGAYEEVRPAAGGTYSLIQRLAVSPVVQYIRRTPVTGTVSALWRFLHRDHLGSVDAISSSNATVVERVSFDGFGGRREKTWVSDITAASTTALLTSEDELSPRGFTDHEMLNRTGFVHMNGRVYDPRIGRFVSADPMVQFPGFSQSYNRYSYTLNSPLSFVDPSGFCIEGCDGSLFGQLSAPNIPGSLGGESSQDSERILALNMLVLDDMMRNGIPWLNDWLNGGRLPAPSVATPPVAPAGPAGDGCSSPAGCGAVAVASGKVSCPAPLECAATTGGTNSDLFDGFGPKALQVSIELGGEGFFGVFGASKSTGFLMDPFRFEVCRVQTTCGRVGLGLFLGVGAEGSISVSAPLTTGTVNSTGVFGRIGIGDVSVGGSLNVSDGGVGGVKGLVGVGGGVVLGVQQCESRVTCE